MKDPLNHHHWLNYFNSLTLSIIGTLLMSDISSANPLCYMIDANGKQVNLSFLCPTAKVLSPTPTTTPSPTANPNPTTTNPPNTQPNTVAPQAVPSPQNNNTEVENKEVDRSKLPPIQRAIPLLQKQKTPEINN